MSLNVANKYDRIADGFAEQSYVNLRYDMHRRLEIVTGWGTQLRPGDSVLELGCGDGYLAQLLIEYGLRYRGVDISPKMIDMTQRRLETKGLQGELMVGDVSELDLSDGFDAVVSFMGSFFSYVANPLRELKRLRPYIRKKVIVDLNPRQSVSRQTAVDVVKNAGFVNVAWRPFFVPKERKLPTSILDSLAAFERIPVIRSVPLNWKFLCLLKGDVGRP